MIKVLKIGDNIKLSLEVNSKESEEKLNQIQNFIDKKMEITKKKYPQFDMEKIISIVLLNVLDNYWDLINDRNSKDVSIIEKLDILNEKILEKIEELNEKNMD